MLFKKFAVVAAIATTLAFVGCSKKEEAATDANAAASEATVAASDAVVAASDVAASDVAASDVAASAAQ
ncbi:Uncharacterised protein [Acinetobacter junii]|uniref:hypothetical protein n=1 Tax=Acinetobacter junii TaxID=40215 RepID=UPI0002D1041F|nr:hypothetical protein [Acinetobacter junii]ENV67487.1 hypothetical protein F948_01020 [Acinetobacter junii CIP 64.5]SUU20108.1 Uncharacterised protein [Acinetobacter junii]